MARLYKVTKTTSIYVLADDSEDDISKEVDEYASHPYTYMDDENETTFAVEEVAIDEKFVKQERASARRIPVDQTMTDAYHARCQKLNPSSCWHETLVDHIEKLLRENQSCSEPS